VTRWRLAGLLALAAALLALAAACGGDEGGEAEPPPPAGTGEPAPPSEEEPPTEEPPAVTKGGVYRLDWEASFNFTNNFDPTGEYLAEAHGIMNQLLVRRLVGYKYVAGPEGNELIPDLAVDMPEVSDDGLTYTFALKDGIMFGPPLSREITSRDVLHAFERIASPALGAQYNYYYVGTIAGMEEVYNGEADAISGIETPDDKTIAFTLTQPTGDFLHRLAMPAAGPIPEEVAGCFDQPGDYGRYLVSSGPYMIEGSDAQDATSCDALRPLPGFDPDAHLVLVRNPDYDPATDTTEARENNPDRFEWRINTNNDDIYNRVAAGEIEDEIASEPPKVLREYTTNDDLEDNFHVGDGDLIWYISMNLTQPPFDDIHVRKAVNLVMNKRGLQLAWGGETAGAIATSTMPPSLLDGLNEGYDPYATPNFEGDVEAAMEEMRQSTYDPDGNGICDEPACTDVLHVTGDAATRVAMIPVMEESLAKIGIPLRTRSTANVYSLIGETRRNVPLTGQSGWGKDYPDASTFAVLFDGRTITPQGNINHSLVGLMPEQAAELGIEGTLEGIPSVDADIDVCNQLTGDERVQCWSGYDQKVMEEVVPWVPYLRSNVTHVTSDAVTKWEFDQNAATISYAHVAVDPSRQ
jgi:peptide/nickel transport system substrate-binding protein